MKDIIIACAGSMGIEAYMEIRAINFEAEKRGLNKPFRFLGFLSDIPVDLVSQGIPERILGTVKDYIPKENEFFYVGLSKPKQKKMVSDLLSSKGAKFANIISPHAMVAKDLIIGTGCLITGSSRVSYGVVLGNFVSIHGSMLYSGAHMGDYSTSTGYTVVENATIGKGVFLGSKAVITEGCCVGNWAQVYAGSVVMGDVKPETNVFGMPAKEI